MELLTNVDPELPAEPFYFFSKGIFSMALTIPVHNRRKKKPVFGVSDQVIPKPACLAFDMIFSNKRITMKLIRLRGCAGWFGPLLFEKPRRHVVSLEANFTL